MKIRAILENISPEQRGVGQLPADFDPPNTSPQLSGPYPGRNATRGYLVGESSDQELYGLRVGDTVMVRLDGRPAQGDIIDIYPDTYEVELLLRGPEAGRTITVDVRDTQALDEQSIREGHADQQRKIFKKNGQPVGEVGIDRESSPGVGQYYMKHYASGTDLSGYDSREEALADLRHVMKQSIYGELREQGVAEGQAGKEDLRKIIVDILERIYFDASSDDDMTDVIADQLGDYYRAVKVSGDAVLKRAYADMRDTADAPPEEQATVALAGIQKLMGPGYRPQPRPPLSPEQNAQVDAFVNQFKAALASQGIRAHPDWNKDKKPGQGVAEAIDISDIDMDLRHIAKTQRMDALVDALRGEFGPKTAQYLHDLMDEVDQDLEQRGMATADMKKRLAMLMNRVQEIYQDLAEAEYRGRDVPLGKPMAGDVKKKKVYVRKPNGNVVKVEFGDKTMRIKKSNPKRRKSFRARHNCENPGPRWKARYWSCRAW